MKNMKRMFSALTALALGSTAAISVVACGNEQATVPHVTMDNEILQRLGLYDSDGSQLRAKLSYDRLLGGLHWNVVDSAGYPIAVSAARLLKEESKAISDKAKEFLLGTLGLDADASGSFSKLEASKIMFVMWNAKPNLIPTKDNDGYTYNEGRVEAFWAVLDVKHPGKLLTPICYVDGIDLKKPEDSNTNLITWPRMIPNLNIKEFDRRRHGLLEHFQVGENIDNLKTMLKEQQEITSELNVEYVEDNSGAEYMKVFEKFFKDLGDVSIKITSLELKDENKNRGEFVAGDKLNFSISLGNVTFNDKYALVLEEIK